MPPNRLMGVDAKFRIRICYGIRGKPKQLIHRVLQMERCPDVEDASSRASKHLEMDDSEKAAMDALTLVCIAMYVQAPLNFRALGPLLVALRSSEGSSQIRGRGCEFTHL